MNTEVTQQDREDFAAATETMMHELTAYLAAWGLENTPVPAQFCAALAGTLTFFIDHLTEDKRQGVGNAITALFVNTYGKAAA